MGECNHLWERRQYWDECLRCGARWNPNLGASVPMRQENKIPRMPRHANASGTKVSSFLQTPHLG